MKRTSSLKARGKELKVGEAKFARKEGRKKKVFDRLEGEKRSQRLGTEGRPLSQFSDGHP